MTVLLLIVIVGHIICFNYIKFSNGTRYANFVLSALMNVNPVWFSKSNTELEVRDSNSFFLLLLLF